MTDSDVLHAIGLGVKQLRAESAALRQQIVQHKCPTHDKFLGQYDAITLELYELIVDLHHMQVGRGKKATKVAVDWILSRLEAIRPLNAAERDGVKHMAPR